MTEGILLPTPGPWRWEFNRAHKSVSLQGGARPFDLTVMDFSRWGTHGAVPSLRDPAIEGMNVMHRLCDREDWIAAFPKRDHHVSWCADVIHPDMRLMALAPDLRDSLKVLLDFAERCEDQIEGEWGRGKSLAKLEADGELSEEIIQAREVLARVGAAP